MIAYSLNALFICDLSRGKNNMKGLDNSTLASPSPFCYVVEGLCLSGYLLDLCDYEVATADEDGISR